MASREDVLSIARGEIGYSRWDDPLPGTKYGRWYAQDHGSYYGESGVPYCAMFVSWVLDHANVNCAGFPGAYCPWIVTAGQNAGRAVNKYDAEPGDVVLFEWDGDGESDHVGIVEVNYGSYLQCIEGNTNNGAVARRDRYFSNVCCVIRPYYDGSSPDGGSDDGDGDSGSECVKEAQRYLQKWGYDIGSAGVDGYDGPDTTRARIEYVQFNMNVYGANLEVDGSNGPLTKGAWNNLDGVGVGSDKVYMVKAAQIALLCHGYSVGAAGIDGDFGGDTEAATRKFQEDNGLIVDGYVGPQTFEYLF